MIKKILFSILLIGFLFNILHDFVFSKFDPCMQSIESLAFDIEKDKSLDPLCDIHKNLHGTYIPVQKMSVKEFLTILDSHILYIPSQTKPLKKEIFKPPTLS